MRRSRAGIPLVIGTCGGAGGAPHLDLVAAMVREIAREDGLHFKMALIQAEQDKASVKRRLAAGRVRPLAQQPDLTNETVDRSTRIVGMMGPEPFIEALDAGAQVVLAGRASDPASWAALATRAQLPPASAWYAGKMLECGATPSIPKGHDCLFVTVREDHVECEPTNPARRCTPAVHRQSFACTKTAAQFTTSSLAACWIPQNAVSRPSAIARCGSPACAGTRQSDTRSSLKAWNWPATGRSASAAHAIRC